MPKPISIKLKCCKCGQPHRVTFRFVNGGAQWQAVSSGPPPAWSITTATEYYDPKPKRKRGKK